MSAPTLRWGILSTGNIARAFADHLKSAEAGKLVAVASRSAEKAEAFAVEFGGTAHGSYDALLADESVDAVYIATPHPQHAEWAIKAARTGKHVLCEKPLTVNAADAAAVVDAAEAAGVTLAEAFMYRCHPQTARLVDELRGGAIGEVQLIECSFCFRAGDDPDGRLLSNDAAGGGILDVGCYTTDLARLLADGEPTDVAGTAHLGQTGVDEWAAATLKFDGGVLAQVRCAVRMNGPGPQLRVTGTEGVLEAREVFIPAKSGGEARFDVRRGDEVREVVTTSDRPLYALEADAFAARVAGQDSPLPTPAETLGNMRVLDRWRRAAGVKFKQEEQDGYRKTTVAGDELRLGSAVPRHEVAGLDRPVASLVMGSVGLRTLADVAPMFDAYWEAGGNAIDTAIVYGWPTSVAIGRWIRHRGVAGEAVVICKGAHTPHNYPDAARGELQSQLDWLGLDRCQLYFLHRDNPDVPAGEFVDALNELADDGLITGPFGGSNWSLERVKEANAYAKANGKRPFGAVSQQLSLAEMVDPVWDGCVSAHGPAWEAWLTQTRTPNFAWSSQARGFFVDGRDLDEDELKRCWVSDANLERRRRAFQLADELGVEPINVAGAWVLRQAYPSFALIGPETLGQLRSTLRTLDVNLTDEQAAWLDLRD